MSRAGRLRNVRAVGVLVVVFGLGFAPAAAETETDPPIQPATQVTPTETPATDPTATPSPTPSPTPSATPSPTPSPTPTSPVPDDRNDPTRAAEYWLDSLGIREAWHTTLGEGVTVAVIDTGIGWSSPAFDNVVGGRDASGIGSGDGRTPLGSDDPGHASRVASLIAARENAAGTGMIGVAPRAQLLSISLNFDSQPVVPFDQQVADAIVWAVDNGADIINLSFTINQPGWPRLWDDAFLYAEANDVLIVVAAGNRGSGTTTVGAPATIPGVLVVAGVDRASHPSQGASTQGVTIGLAAPSEALLGVEPDGSVMQWSGTSGAAPIVAGVAALVRSAYPDLDVNNVIQRLIATATPTAGMQQYPDPIVGYGVVNALQAVTADVGWIDYHPTANMTLERWIELYRLGESDEETPAPVETGDREVPPLAPPDEVTAAGSPWIPSRDSVLYVSIPLMMISTAGILIGLGFTAAARLVKSARKHDARNLLDIEELSSK